MPLVARRIGLLFSAEMRERDLEALGFAGVCARVADFATSSAGRERCRALRPLAARGDADTALDQARDFAQLIERHGRPPLGSFPDVRPHLQRAAVAGFVLDGESLVEVRSVLECLQHCRAFFRGCAADLGSLAALVAELPAFPPLAEALTRALDHDGSVLDQASDELAAVRAAIRKLRDSLARKLGDLIARRGMADVVADQYVTLRNDRFVIPVKAGATSRIQGVVQDRSVSGETFFVEPLFAVELNNQLLAAVRDEEAIVRRILADLTALVRRDAEAIGAAVERLGDIDCAAARALFAGEYDCTRPIFSDGEVALRDARHPGLSFTGRPVTPIDILLPADKRALVITGPNTGGKTVALKTLGLAALMARSGLLVPAAEGAVLPFFTDVFTDVGDEQNIERDLSTFSAHVANLKEVLAAAGDASLVLLDEPGVGTDPEEGAALAVGLLRYFEKRSARIAVTTHYRPVKVHAIGSDACRVCAVDFDVERLEPRYRLVYQSLGRSLALPIAERLGLQSEVLEAARQEQSADSRTFSDVLERLEAARRELESARAELAGETAALEQQRQALREREIESARLAEDLRERRQRAWKDELREAREFVRELKDRGRAQLRAMRSVPAQHAEFARFVRRQEDLIEARANPVAAEPQRPDAGGQRALAATRPAVGDTVAVGDRGIEGELLSIDGERAWVQRGTLRFEVPSAQLTKIATRQRARPPQVRFERATDQVEREITLVGMRARQALELLERFLDRAAQSSCDTVRIVHGVGSGALQRAVRDYLSNSPYCADFRSGEEGEGGAGVTVAKLS
jgi:DNA mismatch repair protein MutS2